MILPLNIKMIISNCLRKNLILIFIYNINMYFFYIFILKDQYRINSYINKQNIYLNKNDQYQISTIKKKYFQKYQ